MALVQKPFQDFFEKNEAQLRSDSKREFTPKEAALIETWFQRWCKANGMDNMKAPPTAKIMYLAAVITGITYAGQELKGKYRDRPFHGEGG